MATIPNEADVPLLGASLVALHLPTGRRRAAISNATMSRLFLTLLAGAPTWPSAAAALLH